jgi:hypothetical protein
MFGQIFIFFIAIFSLIMGLQEGNYIWAFCGLIMTLSGVHHIYKLKSGKNIWDKSSTK